MYGVLLKDWFVTVSNFSGTLSGVLQLLFFAFMKLFIIKPEDMIKKEEKVEYHEDIKIEMKSTATTNIKSSDEETDNENDDNDNRVFEAQEDNTATEQQQSHHTINMGSNVNSTTATSAHTD